MDPIFDYENIVAAVDRLPNLFSRVGELGVYNAGGGVPTHTVTVARRNGRIVLLDPVARDGKRQEANRDTKTAKTFDVPTFKFGDKLLPSDIQGITAFQPGPKQLENMANQLNRRLLKTRQPHDQTFEFYRMQGLKGIISDPLGNEMYDLFQVFGVTKKVIYFDLDNPNSKIGEKIEELEDHIATNLRGDVSNGTHVFTASDFQRKLKRHSWYEKYLTGHAAALQQLDASRENPTNPNARRRIQIEDTTFESYTGEAENSAGDTVKFVADGVGHAFPVGTVNTFFEHDAPPERMSKVNQVPDTEIFISTKELDHDQGIDIDTESCKICLCAQPEVLVEVSAAAGP